MPLLNLIMMALFHLIAARVFLILSSIGFMSKLLILLGMLAIRVLSYLIFRLSAISSLPLKDIRGESIQWRFHLMVPPSLLGHGIPQSSYGMLRHGQILPRVHGLRVAFIQCHFHPMGPSSLLGQGTRSLICGTLLRGQ